MPAGPFEGVRVLELGQYVSIPYCAELLAHGGADVIKVEPIGGDETRLNTPIVPGEGRQYIIKARGKRGIPLDLGRPEGVAVARRLALTSDVVLSNMRPGGLERLGLDYDTISAEHPPVIYGEISGFGRSPDRGDRASIDIVAQAASGLLLATRGLEGSHAVATGAFLSDYMSGTMLAFGITTALRTRDATGRGQRVETTLMQGSLALLHGSANLFEAVDGPRRQIAEAATSGELTQAEAFEAAEALRPSPFFYQTYETADGAVAVGAPGHLSRRFLEVAGVEDPRASAEWREAEDARPLVRALTEAVTAALRQRTTAELLAELQTAGIPAERIAMLDEVLISDEATEAGWTYRADHPAVGPMTMPTAPLSFSESPYEAASTSPAFGAHTRQVLTELGYSHDEIEKLIADAVTATRLA